MPLPRRSVSIMFMKKINWDWPIFLHSLELYFKDSRSLLIVFSTKRKRQDFSDKISSFMEAKNLAPARSPLMRRTPMLGKMSAKVFSGFRDELFTAQRRWQAREISNVSCIEYLSLNCWRRQSSSHTLAFLIRHQAAPLAMRLNTLSFVSYTCNAIKSPLSSKVKAWILSDYTSDTLDLTKASTFRE